MKKMNLLAIAVATSLTAGAATGAAIDFRHEWRDSVEYNNNDGSEKSKDVRQSSRVKISDSWKYDKQVKFNAGLEVKFQDKKDTSKFLSDPYIYETELDLGSQYTIDKNWYIQIGMPIAFAFENPDSSKDHTLKKVTYKPQFRVGYKADMGLTTALRYRHEFADFRNYQTYGDKNVYGDRQSNPQKYKVTLTGSYKIESLPKLSLAYEANYVKSLDNVLQYNDKDWEWDLGFKTGYKFGSWQPFAEIWTVDLGSTTDEREMKYRLGIKYSF
ncbi:porin [Vibrio sp. SM6]|uniref:Porin n=1 Tax=Vibrio agarilyticus TaxID=2726741 RepID=A0A7X8TRR1_9VIBR|nr:oligogalacturonate-specific porin KdgM family protein [Vibrio agarilyticus]NLS13767.1 porin [Vibrio agarilyticus]